MYIVYFSVPRQWGTFIKNSIDEVKSIEKELRNQYDVITFSYEKVK